MRRAPAAAGGSAARRCLLSSPEKETLARAAGAHHVVNSRTGDTAGSIRAVAPDGVDLVVEVAPAANAELDVAVMAPTAVAYANDGGEKLILPVLPLLFGNQRWQGVLVYSIPATAKDNAVAAVSAAIADGALQVGEESGLPQHLFPLESAAEAHAAVEQGAVGKVLIELP